MPFLCGKTSHSAMLDQTEIAVDGLRPMIWFCETPGDGLTSPCNQMSPSFGVDAKIETPPSFLTRADHGLEARFPGSRTGREATVSAPRSDGCDQPTCQVPGRTSVLAVKHMPSPAVHEGTASLRSITLSSSDGQLQQQMMPRHQGHMAMETRADSTSRVWCG